MFNCQCDPVQQLNAKVDLINNLCEKAKIAALSNLSRKRDSQIITEFKTVQKEEPPNPTIKQVQLLHSSN